MNMRDYYIKGTGYDPVQLAERLAPLGYNLSWEMISGVIYLDAAKRYAKNKFLLTFNEPENDFNKLQIVEAENPEDGYRVVKVNNKGEQDECLPFIGKMTKEFCEELKLVLETAYPKYQK